MFFCYNQTGKIAWGGTAIERCSPPDTAKARLLRRPAEGRRRGGEKNAAERERLLEVEMPTEEMSKRRIGFYERLGFVLDHHVYFQPPYRKGEAFLEMRLMTHGELDLERSFERVKTIIHQNVYGVK